MITVATSSENRRRIRRVCAWLENRALDEELVLIGAHLDSVNELARNLVKERGAAFGWHRLTLPQLAASVAAPEMAGRGVVPVGRLATDAIIAGLLHRHRVKHQLGRFQPIAGTPGFSRGALDREQH